MELKNELFVAQKNAEIEIDAYKSQLLVKEQHLEQIEKDHVKAKTKYES